MVSHVRKRDGRVVPFDKERITTAIFKAALAVSEEDRKLAEELADQVVKKIEENFREKIPTVEEIQDIVENVLVENGHYKTAKGYILYRERHTKIRHMKSTFIDVQNTISDYVDKADWRVRENSNEDYSFSGLLLYTAGKVIANYVLDEMYPPNIADAHRKGYMHIHDLSHGLVAYCAGWSLKNLLLMGFGGVANKANAKPAKHLSAIVHHIVNYIGCLQMEFAGAQSFASLDTLLAPFIKTDDLSYKQVRQAVQELIFSLNIPSRWGSQFPFSNITFDWVVPEEMRDEHAIVGGKQQSFTYGDCQEEANMINRAFIELMLEGDADGSVFTFPIPTYNITKDFDWENENTSLLFEMTAKYGLPYFQNYVSSGLDPKSIHSMCCHLNINLKELIQRPGHTFAAGDNTGSIGVVTVNLNRLCYEAKNEDRFFELLSQIMLMAKDSLETKRKIIEKNLKAGLMPYTKVYLGSFKNHFSTIGLIGMNEGCLNLLGVDIADEEGKKIAIKTLKFMRDRLKEFQQETGNLYNLEATPAEGASHRLARLDKRYCPGIITSGVDYPYLTNSTQLPVYYTDDIVFAIKHQSEIQPLYTGGTVFHTFLGQRTSGENCKELVRKLTKTVLPYFTITPTFSICREHGYFGGETSKCPKCGKDCEVYSRVVGYFRPIRNWNDGKREEFKMRKTYDLAIPSSIHALQ